MLSPIRPTMHDVPIQANAMGHELHSHTDFSQARMVGRAALAAVFST